MRERMRSAGPAPNDGCEEHTPAAAAVAAADDDDAAAAAKLAEAGAAEDGPVASGLPSCDRRTAAAAAATPALDFDDNTAAAANEVIGRAAPALTVEAAVDGRVAAAGDGAPCRVPLGVEGRPRTAAAVGDRGAGFGDGGRAAAAALRSAIPPLQAHSERDRADVTDRGSGTTHDRQAVGLA
jgi:hypothetical protein